uniref:cation:proton antiporter domain-containing protein n=2 Tax=uncultured Rothia sp. TaxID=316088 RepID=UPI0025FB310B|nr:cation:proton antiporter [uncultured Rothia sp.]
MDPLLIAVAGLLIIVACQFVAPKVGVASPLILLVVGLAIGFLPQVGAIEIEPNIILEMVLPPLLFSAAVRMPTMDFRREMQAVAMLAIPLVFLSAFAVGFVINWLVPAISLPWGVALGAVLSPTDAVAVSIAKRSGVSHRIITVLEGEGLFNDATSLVMLSAAMSAGLVVSRRRAATISAANRRFSQQNWQTMTLVLESGIFLTMGLQAFGIVEETAAFSGGLAFAAFLAVTLGALIMVIRAVFIALMFTWLDHRHKRRQRRYEAEAARIERFEKRMHKASEVDADMLQARDLSPERWEDALNHYRRRLKRRARRNAMRGSDLDYFESEPLGPREGSVIVWAGMRGAITLAAAQTISTHAPMRAFLLTIALFIAAGALVIQGLTLPGLIRIVKPKMATGDISEEERAKLLKVMGSALVDTALAQAIHEVDGQTLLSAGVSRTLSRIGHAVSVEDEAASARIARTADRVLTDILQDGTPPDAASASETDDDGHGTVDMSEEEVERSFTRDQIRELALEAIHAQRDALLQARDEGIFSSAALEIESNVSLADVAMTLQRMEMVNRIIREVSHYVLELGVHGRLIALQLEELRAPEMTASDLILRDYLPEANDELIAAGVQALQNLDGMGIVDLRAIARTVGFGENPDLETPLQPRGFRLLAGIPSIPNAIAERLVERFGSLQALMAASLEDLRAVDGVGEARARTVREQLTRMAESSLERYL